MKSKKFIAIFIAMLTMVMSVCVVLADSQNETATRYGIAVKCTLNCTFNTFANDRAKAKTSWDGKSNYAVVTMLYSRDNILSSYKMHDCVAGYTEAEVSASVGGAWDFKSTHYATSIDMNNFDELSPLCTLTDW